MSKQVGQSSASNVNEYLNPEIPEPPSCLDSYEDLESKRTINYLKRKTIEKNSSMTQQNYDKSSQVILISETERGSESPKSWR